MVVTVLIGGEPDAEVCAVLLSTFLNLIDCQNILSRDNHLFRCTAMYHSPLHCQEIPF